VARRGYAHSRIERWQEIVRRPLRAVAPLDSYAFLTSLVDDVNRHAPLAGIERGGWKLAYDDTPNDFLSAREKVDGPDNLSLSLGLNQPLQFRSP
jgi:hypothetical protein